MRGPVAWRSFPRLRCGGKRIRLKVDGRSKAKVALRRASPASVWWWAALCFGDEATAHASVAGGAGRAADGDGDLGAGRGAVQVDQRVSGAVGLIAVGVAAGGRGGVLVWLIRVHVDVVLVVIGVVDARGGRAPCA